MSLKLHEPIYVVDDEPDLLDIVKELLTSRGYYAKTFLSAAKALESIKAEPPFLIISDFNMPQMNGLDFCGEVRKVLPQIPFVILTGRADKELAVASLSAGVNDLIDKPLQENLLFGLIKKYADIRVQAIEAERLEIARDHRALC